MGTTTFKLCCLYSLQMAGPVREGIRRSRSPRVSQLWVKQLVSTRHHWANSFTVRRKGPDGRKGSTMNSKATCSTWRGTGSVRLHFSRDSPCDDNKQPYTGSVAARVNKDSKRAVENREKWRKLVVNSSVVPNDPRG